MEVTLKELQQKVKNYFRNEEIGYEEVEENIFRCIIGLYGKIPKVNYWLFVDDENARSCHLLPVYVKEKYRAEVAKLLLMLNTHMKRGLFDIDFKDGEVKYKYCVTATELNMNTEMVMHRLYNIGADVTDDCSDFILSVAYGMKSAEEAYHDYKDFINKLNEE